MTSKKDLLLRKSPLFYFSSSRMHTAAETPASWLILRKNLPPAASPAASPDSAARPDWRVYAVDRNDNCFTGSGIVLEKEQDEFIMGRGEGCDLKLMLPQIGRRHARVTRRGAVYIYQDLGSKAGSVCRGEKIESEPLEHMMVVMVCDVALVFVNGAARQEHVLSAVRNARV